MNIRKTIGIAGTAKNTGKTTTTLSLLDYYYTKGVTIGLTSIGYDGETMDNVTGLPKPRLFVRKGLLIVTAEKCLQASSAKVKILENLGINTPLGKLVCAVVEREGLIVTAGPNQSHHLRTVRDLLFRYGAELIIVDGALGRIAPMIETDGFIMATGASYKLDSYQVARHAHYLAEICNYPQSAKDLLKDPAWVKLLDSLATVVWNSLGEILAEVEESLLNPEQLGSFYNHSSDVRGLYCPGLITTQCLQKLGEIPFSRGMTYIFSDPIKLIVGNDLKVTHDFLTTVQQEGSALGYKQMIPLMAITVNPFYPKYRYESGNYETAYIDKGQLLEEVTSIANVPVFDIVQDSCTNLAKIIFDTGK